MASNETILAWKAELQGADNVKDGLRKINEEVKKGNITEAEKSKVLGYAIKDTRNYTLEQKYLNRSFMALHPTLNTLTRSMSTLAGVARAGMNIANSLNSMWTRQNTLASGLSDAHYELAKATRARISAEKEGDPQKIADAFEAEAIQIQRIKDLMNQDFWGKFTDALTVGSVLSTAITSAFTALMKNTAVATAVTNIGTKLGTTFGAAFQLAAVAAIFILAATGIEEAYKKIFNITDVDAWREANVKALTDLFTVKLPIALGIAGALIKGFFTQSIPLALGEAGMFLTNFFLTDLPNWVGIAVNLISDAFLALWGGIQNMFVLGFEFIKTQIASFIESIKRFISDIINLFRTISFAGGGGSSVGGGGNNVQTNPWGLNTKPKKSATGFNGMVNGPTVFLAGEAGPEQVSITPSGRNTGSGGGITVVVNVQGSILTERELFRRVDENLKNELRKRNFRILQ